MAVKKKKKYIAVLLLLAIVMAILLPQGFVALWDPDNAVKINPSDIENATLIIGSHLIYIGSLTNALYSIASESAIDSGQDRIYYKSELAGGTWFDISSASTLVDITTGGSPVNTDVIAALLMTHHTKSDGVTYDLRTGAAVNIFNIRTPYELESMTELMPLKTEYDLTMEMQAESEYGAAKIDMMSEFFETEVVNDTTREYDESLDALQRYYNVLNDFDGGAAEMGAVQDVMDAVDAARRAEVMTIVDAALQALAQTLQSVEDTEGDDEGGEASSGSGSDPNLQSAVNDSITNVLESLTLYSGKMLTGGTTVLSQVKYDACLKLIEDAKANNHTACDEDVAVIIALNNIQNSVIGDKQTEINQLESPLIVRATALYMAAVREGENDEYRTAVDQNAAAAMKNGIVQRAKNQMSILRSELEFFISAYCERLDTADALDYVGVRLGMTNELLGRIPNDSFQVAASESVEAHIDFLTKLQSKLQAKAGGTEASKLRAEKAALQTELLSALDDNNLALAREIESKIAEIDDLLDETGDDVGALVDELLSEAKSIISNGGDLGDLEELIDALNALLDTNYGAVFPALEELHNDMARKRDIEGNGNFDDMIGSIEDTLLENKAAYDASMQPALSAKTAEEIIDGFLSGGDSLFDAEGTGLFDDGADVSGLSDDEKDIVRILAIDMYRDTSGDTGLDGLMHAAAQRLNASGSPMIYLAIQDSSARYLPAYSVAFMKKMRYVWHPSLSEATLARGGEYYSYTVYSQEVKLGKQGSEVHYMSRPAGYLRGLHLPDDYTLDTFELWALYVPGTEYGIVVNQQLYDLAVELYALLLRG